MIYTFEVSLQEEDDGRWSAWIESLPGCATWGYTKDDALQSLHEAAVLVLEDMIECGEPIPPSIESGDGMQVAVPA
jgi:predicted RNase H-like HicB family nuclease